MCSCEECVGPFPEPTDEELKAMDQQIKPVHDRDIILWHNGTWDYREHVLINLEDTRAYSVLAYGSPDWLNFRNQEEL